MLDIEFNKNKNNLPLATVSYSMGVLAIINVHDSCKQLLDTGMHCSASGGCSTDTYPSGSVRVVRLTAALSSNVGRTLVLV